MFFIYFRFTVFTNVLNSNIRFTSYFYSKRILIAINNIFTKMAFRTITITFYPDRFKYYFKACQISLLSLNPARLKSCYFVFLLNSSCISMRDSLLNRGSDFHRHRLILVFSFYLNPITIKRTNLD